jgi:metallo-beta-lactamase family protein
MNITFLGATGTVTGSKYLVEGSGKVLVDCGLFQGYKQLRLRNRAPFLTKPSELDAVILTHAHLDHSGYLPLLVKNGYRGKVYCSEATRDLCAILLPDSGRLQEEEAEYANRHGYSKHHPALPLYTSEDAQRALAQLTPVDFDRTVEIADRLRFTLLHAGHILGAAMVRLEDGATSVLFTGDLGRPNDPIMPAPDVVKDADYLVIESTYGNRRHDPTDPKRRLAEVINRTAARGGVVIVPAFAVERAQALMYYLHELNAARAIPGLPIYLNSPMAADVTRLFREHPNEHRLTRGQYEAMRNGVHVVTNVEESRRLNELRAPAILIAGSGMAAGGRVLHHLKAYAPDPRNTILFTGFQAGGTRGAAILQGAEAVKIHGDYVRVRAEVARIDNLSAHADYAETLDWLGNFTSPPALTFVTHGEPDAADAMRKRIEERFRWSVQVPEYLERVELPTKGQTA